MNAAQILDPELLQKENVELRCEVVYLKEQLAWFKRQVFGRRSERIISELDAQQLEFAGFQRAADRRDHNHTRAQKT